MSIGPLKSWPRPPARFKDLVEAQSYLSQLYVALTENCATIGKWATYSPVFKAVTITDLPTASAGLATGTLWNSSGTVKVA